MSKISLIFFVGFAFIAFSTTAHADGIEADVLQRLLAKDGKQSVSVRPLKNDDALRLTMNRDQVIRLNQDAASVIVNNPEHAEVMLDSPRLLIVMPRAPGATSFTVLNSAGDIILRRDIIVSNVQPKYVRIRRMCAGAADCVPAAYYYCPDGCYEVTPVAASVGGNIPPAPPAATAANTAAGLPGNAPAPQLMNPNVIHAAPVGNESDNGTEAPAAPVLTEPPPTAPETEAAPAPEQKP